MPFTPTWTPPTSTNETADLSESVWFSREAFTCSAQISHWAAEFIESVIDAIRRRQSNEGNSEPREAQS